MLRRFAAQRIRGGKSAGRLANVIAADMVCIFANTASTNSPRSRRGQEVAIVSRVSGEKRYMLPGRIRRQPGHANQISPSYPRTATVSATPISQLHCHGPLIRIKHLWPLRPQHNRVPLSVKFRIFRNLAYKITRKNQCSRSFRIWRIHSIQRGSLRP